ncbi:MAG: alpha/beta fold hydrolase [Acidobacteriaceae bacterium]
MSIYVSSGARIFYHSVGAGPDLVLLHPTPVHHGFWIPVALALSDSYRVILPDLRGHGQSESGEGPITVARLAEDIERLLDAAGIQAALFAGCSIGSYTLYELWRRIPQRMRGLAFCCGKPQPDTAANRSKRAENIENIRVGGTAGFFDNMTETLVGPTSRAQNPERSLELRAMMDSMTSQAVVAIQQGLAERPDSTPTIATITVPVFALAGGEDGASTPQEMAVIHELLPQSSWQVLPHAGHYAPYEQPEPVAGLLREFFRDLENR